ncbi:polymorphic toxin type 15 domain-containing protein [Actinomyces lilanjuaniae]|uniref:polymorphic toxin type 15 domain-containing protein n=1 Tax=Actinomyces lilanjuaniae TaxID=2321394 RepID=UPI0013C4473A|nr:polymorphic toxin type 15 domain-containing protein [Actinomyces lilanjuaniae]
MTAAVPPRVGWGRDAQALAGRPRWLRRGRPTAPAAGPAAPGGVPGGGPVPGHSGGGQAPGHGGAASASALVASDMFTPGRAGGQGVLVWEGAAAAPDSPLAWHSRVPVEVFFHTGHHDSTRVLAPEFTRQLDRQFSALSLLSAERLLEGIRAYRDQGRQPTSKATRKRRKKFMKEVVGDLQRVHRLSREDARAATREVDRALVVLHEPDQLLAGPGGPATTGPQPGYPSLGHGQVNSSIGGQNKPMVAVLEQAALAVPPDQRPRVRLLVRAVLTGSPDLAQDLRAGQAHLEPRTQAQVSATSPRGPPWTPTHVASTIATGHTPGTHHQRRTRDPARHRHPSHRSPPRASRATRSAPRRFWLTSRPASSR